MGLLTACSTTTVPSEGGTSSVQPASPALSAGPNPAPSVPDHPVAVIATPALPSTEEEKRVYGLIEKDHLMHLERLVGRYARGEAAIYRGSFAARDNLASLGRQYDDGVIDSVDVMASLAWEDGTYVDGRRDGGWGLRVYAPSQAHRVMLHQYPDDGDITRVSLVSPRNTSFGVNALCHGCLTTLSAMPTVITVSPLVADGKYGNDAPLRVTAGGTLTRIPAAEVTFEHLVASTELGPRQNSPGYPALFVRAGDDWVRAAEDELHEPTPVPADQPYYECHHVTTYSLDWYAGDQHITRYGLRNFRISKAQTCCVDRADQPCDPGHRTCF